MELWNRRHSLCSSYINIYFSILLLLFIFFCSLHSHPVVDTCGDKDCYDVLGVSNEANSTEIKKAFRKLSVLHHPDKAPEDQKEEASKKFIEISQAYQILSDDESRKHYDDLISGKAQGKNEGAGSWTYKEYQPSFSIYESSYTLPITVIVTILTLVLPWLILSSKRSKRGRTVPTRPTLTPSSKKETIKETKSSKDMQEPKEPREPRKKPVVEEFEVAQLTPVLPSYLLNDYTKEEEKQVKEEVAREWTTKDTELLIKATARFPGGTKDRWLKIAEYVERSVSEVLEKSKELTAKAKTKERGDAPPELPLPSLPANEQPEQPQKPAKKATNQNHSSPTTPASLSDLKSSSSPPSSSTLADPTEWTTEEQKALEKALKSVAPKDPERWEKISKEVGSKTKEQCLARFKFISELLKKKKKADTNE